MDDEHDTRTSHDPSRNAGQASSATPPRGRDAAVTEDPSDSPGITKGGALWIAFPVTCVVVLVVVLVLIFR